MENGYVSSPYDAANMVDPVAIETKAKAMARGVAKYYLELNACQNPIRTEPCGESPCP